MNKSIKKNPRLSRESNQRNSLSQENFKTQVATMPLFQSKEVKAQKNKISPHKKWMKYEYRTPTSENRFSKAYRYEKESENPK